MRFLAALLIAAPLLAAGCANLTGRTRDRDRDKDTPPPPRSGDRPWWQDGTDTPAARSKGKPGGKLDRETIIAGEVVDGREGRRMKGKTYIVVRTADEVTPAAGKGNVGFETDDDGYFFMPGLAPGKTYILSAVRELDGRKVAAEMQVKPPAGNLRLVLGDGQVSSLTPPLPPPPGLGPFEPKGDPATTRPPEAAPPPPADPAAPVRRESIATLPTNAPPTAAIRPPPAAAPDSRPADPPPADEPPMARGGKHVPNFVLADLTGGEWEFRYAAGRLILMDFWGTTCTPCLRAVPAMKRLQSDYGQSGLEIVAVACEANAPLATRAKDVEEVARRKEMNYRVYLERDGKVGEVQKLFQVQWIPTLVLLDRQGNVLWRGGATEADLNRVEGIIKEHLTKR